MSWEQVYKAVSVEAEESQAKFGDFASMHEAYGVLAEEFDELFEAIKLRQENGARPGAIWTEAIQVAAVAMRIAEQCGRVKR